VLRPHNFREHDTHFLLHWAVPDSAAASPAAPGSLEYVCRRVPLHLREQHWAALLTEHAAGLTDQLVLHQSDVTRVLSKFESQHFIHAYVDAATPAAAGSSGQGASSGSRKRASIGKRKDASSSSADGNREGPQRAMLFELPRFGLEFELRGGELRSLDYAGYRLRACQQLVVPRGSSGRGQSRRCRPLLHPARLPTVPCAGAGFWQQQRQQQQQQQQQCGGAAGLAEGFGARGAGGAQAGRVAGAARC
jgi:hypothetical protein